MTVREGGKGKPGGAAALRGVFAKIEKRRANFKDSRQLFQSGVFLSGEFETNSIRFFLSITLRVNDKVILLLFRLSAFG